MNTEIQEVLKKRYFYTICVLLISLAITIISLRASAQITTIDTKEKALTLVKNQLSKQQYTAYLPEECFFYLTSERENYFIVEIYELGAKTEKCKKTDNKVSLVVLYKVNRNGSTQVFDSLNFTRGEMVPYQDNYAKIINNKTD